MANQYRFLPDFSVFENDEQNDVSTEDTNSSIMSRNKRNDTDASGTGGDFLERFYQNLRGAFNDDDKFKQTFMPNKRPKPDISELRSYVDRVKGSSDIEDALLEATGMYNTGTPSDDNSMTIKDASDGITVPKQPDVMVDELSSSLGSYLRNRANKGSSFVGEGVQMASAGSLSVEDMDLARMMAGQTMRKEAAEMGLPVVDMEEEAKKTAVEAARERAKRGITQSKGAPQGLMSPVASDPRVDMAASGLNEDDPLGRVRPEVATAEVEPLTDDDMGLPNDDNYMGYLPDTPEQKLLDRIALGEGADPEKLKAQKALGIGSSEYDMVYAYGSMLAPNKPVTKMTLAELYKYQTDLINKTKGKIPGTTLGTSAAGKYQVLRSSLFGAGTPEKPAKDSWADKLDLKADTIYTPAVQEAIGRLALKETGYYNWKKGKKSESSMLKRVSDIWASVEGSTAGQGTHTTKKDLEPILSLVRPKTSSKLAPKTSLRPKARPDTRVASN